MDLCLSDESVEMYTITVGCGGKQVLVLLTGFILIATIGNCYVILQSPVGYFENLAGNKIILCSDFISDLIEIYSLPDE